MLTKSILTAATISLAASLGSASAGELFSTLAGVEAQPLSPHMMGKVRGSAVLLSISPVASICELSPIGCIPGIPPTLTLQIARTESYFSHNDVFAHLSVIGPNHVVAFTTVGCGVNLC